MFTLLGNFEMMKKKNMKKSYGKKEKELVSKNKCYLQLFLNLSQVVNPILN